VELARAKGNLSEALKVEPFGSLFVLKFWISVWFWVKGYKKKR